jgi:hypothetical protein
MTTIAELFGTGDPAYRNATDFIAGVECEIEAVKNPGPVGIFNAVPDGSLRNKGIEFISIPSTKNDLVSAFKHLHGSLQFYPGQEPFSVRTSTHVHVNCLSLDVPQARIMVLLYALFEECFFLMVKPDRRDNIHCVPLTETYMPSLYKRPVDYMIKNWHKYTALNLKRMVDLGTMEFRHLHGTSDAAEFEEWLGCLEALWKLCQRVEINVDTLTKENIVFWFECIFSKSPRVMAMRHSLFDIIRNSLIDVKFSV